MKASVLFLACVFVLSASACGGDGSNGTVAVGDGDDGNAVQKRGSGAAGTHDAATADDEATTDGGAGGSGNTHGRDGSAEPDTRDGGARSDGGSCPNGHCAPAPDCSGDACPLADGGEAAPWHQVLHAKASNPDIDDRFGSSVAVSGDLIVVGAPAESSDATGVDGDEASDTATGSGAAYVFRKTSDAWVQEAYLKASNTDADDAFGSSVAVFGDVVVVGAPQESSKAKRVDGDDGDDSLISAGAAYVFRRVAGTWQQDAYLKANSPSEGDWFGVSVAISGDVIVVGADQEDGSALLVDGADDETAPNSGAAYVYRYVASSWQYEAYLKASNTGAGDGFGHCVAIAGDVIAISAPGEDSDEQSVGGTGANDNATDSGAAYVYRYSGSTWQHEAFLKASNTGAGDDFGSSIALADAILVVGADQEDSAANSVDGDGSDNSASASGAAYVYRYASNSWTHAAYLKPTNPGPDDRFGVSVAAGPDMVAVGAHDEDGSGSGINPTPTEGAQHAGAVYVFRDPGSGFDQEAYLKGSEANLDYNRFGWSVSFADGRLAVGARDDAGGGMGIEPASNTLSAASGALYVFE